MRKCIGLLMFACCWGLLSFTAQAQVADPQSTQDATLKKELLQKQQQEQQLKQQQQQAPKLKQTPTTSPTTPVLNGPGAGGRGMGGQPLPGFVQNPGQFPGGFVPGGQGMGGQALPPGFQPTVPVGQVMGLRALQMMGAGNRGVQYGAGGNMNNTMNGYNNPNFANPNFGVPSAPQVDPEQLKRDEKRSKVRERAELKRAKDKEQAELRKLKAQDPKDKAPQAKAEEVKK